MNEQRSSGLENKQSRSRTGRLKQAKGRREQTGKGGGRVSYSHLEVRDELSHSDFLCYLLVQTLAVQDHALQDSQGPLKDGHIYHGLAHVPCNLKPERANQLGSPGPRGAGQRRFLKLAHEGSLLSGVLPVFRQLSLGREWYQIYGYPGQCPRDSLSMDNSISNYSVQTTTSFFLCFQNTGSGMT